MINLEKARAALAHCHFPGYAFHVVGDLVASNGPTYLQARFMAPCAVGGEVQEQTTRKWLLSPHMTTSELIQTAFKCVLTSVEHEAREQFKYRGASIFGPHFDVEALVDIHRANRLEVRQ